MGAKDTTDQSDSEHAHSPGTKNLFAQHEEQKGMRKYAVNVSRNVRIKGQKRRQTKKLGPTKKQNAETDIFSESSHSKAKTSNSGTTTSSKSQGSPLSPPSSPTAHMPGIATEEDIFLSLFKQEPPVLSKKHSFKQLESDLPLLEKQMNDGQKYTETVIIQRLMQELEKIMKHMSGSFRYVRCFLIEIALSLK